MLAGAAVVLGLTLLQPQVLVVLVAAVLVALYMRAVSFRMQLTPEQQAQLTLVAVEAVVVTPMQAAVLAAALVL